MFTECALGLSLDIKVMTPFMHHVCSETFMAMYYSHCYAGQDSRPGGGGKQIGEASKHENGNQDGYGAPVLDNSIPLQTTPELFATVTEVFVPKEIIPKLDYRRMDFDPAISPAYIPCVELLKASGRRLNTTTADGNCLFRSLSKALLGTENFHYRIRTTLFGFIYLNSKFFLPHIEQRYKSKVEIRQYCLEMDTVGVWGTDVELLAAATMLQAPIYTYTQPDDSGEYRWSRHRPLAQPSQVVCDYVPSIRRLVHMTKPPNYHLELLHFNGNHYDLIVSDEKELNYPPLSNFTCNIVCN